MHEPYDVVVVGAGAAGLMAAISARRANPACRVLALDGARKLGAKILIAGGGRCNVTHYQVDETAFAGSSRNAVRNVLGRFDVAKTVAFFEELGVSLKREETGKLFPVTDDARTVLNALLAEARRHGVEIQHPRRVTAIKRNGDFVVTAEDSFSAQRVIIATGGKSIPKSGSDGFGYELVKSLGHFITPLVTPGLVPLTLPPNHFLCSLAGVTLDATITLRSGTGKTLVSFTNSTLLTHFGLSGPSVLDISRYYLHAIASDAGANLFINLLPESNSETLDNELQSLRNKSIGGFLRDKLPERLVRTLCAQVGVDIATRGNALKRDQRRAIAATFCNLPLPITGSRGYNFAEVTSGGVPLSELHLDSMESRMCPGLYLCGEICDVDGRIGGFNFQWAWSSGFVAGTAAARP